MKLDAKTIQLLLIERLIDRKTGMVIPNYYLDHWESDVLMVSDKGYVTEYEIKISRSDFFADLKKESTSFNFQLRERTSINKHDRTMNGLRRVNRFVFVVPRGLVGKEEVPSYAGLIEVTENGYLDQTKNPKLVRKDPLIPINGLYKDLLDKFFNRYLYTTYLPKMRKHISNLEKKSREVVHESL